MSKYIILFLVITSQLIFANEFEQFETSRESVLKNHDFSISNLKSLTEGQQNVVFSSKLLPSNSDIKEVYYPVWANKSLIFLARTSRGAYRFLEFKIDQESHFLDELTLKSEEESDLFSDDLMIPVSLDEPPLRNPVINKDNELVAFLLTDFNEGITKVCYIDPSDNNNVKFLHYGDRNEVIRSLTWYDESNLIFIKSKVSGSSDVYKLNINSQEIEVLFKGYDKFSYSYSTGEFVCVQSDSFESKMVYFSNKNKKEYELYFDGEINRLSFNPNGNNVALLKKDFNQYDLIVVDLSNKRKTTVNDMVDYEIFYTDIGAIYSDYSPVWDNYNNLYFGVKPFDFVTQISRYNVDDGEVYDVYDLSDQYKSISAFDVSQFYLDDNKGGSQLVVCGLELRKRNRTAELFFLNKNNSGE